MKKLKITKRIIALVLTFLMVFSAVNASAASWEEVYAQIIKGEATFAIEEHEHIYGDWVITKNPTCSAAGERVKTCIYSSGSDVCGYEYSQTIPAVANAHDGDTGIVITEATCTSEGITKYTCKLCRTEYEVENPKTEHVFNDDDWQLVSPAYHHETKVQKGLEINNCTTCGKTVSRDIEVVHDFSGSVATVMSEPTCSTEGKQYQKCNICKTSYVITIEKDPTVHVYSGKAFLKDGTVSCVTGGQGIIVCEECGEITYVEIPAEDAHDYIDWEVRTELPEDATCLNGKTGYELRYCETCATTLEYRVTTGPHTFDEDEIIGTYASTCTTKGYQLGNCTKCGKMNVKNELPIDENAHAWVEKVIQEPTCSEKGVLFKICKYDSSHIEYEIIEKLEHTYTGVWTIVEPNCTQAGYKENYCSECQANIRTELPVDPEAHVFDGQTWSRTKDPTCTEVGREGANCTKCFEIIYRDIPMHSDTYSSYDRVEATCCLEGKISYSCYLCSNEFEETIPVDPEAHSPSNSYQVVLTPTCHTTGIRSRVCNYCRTPIEENQIVIPEVSHTVGEWTVKTVAGCETVGEKMRECLNDGCVYVETVDIPASHRYTAWSELGQADCTIPAVRERRCYTCGTTESETFYGDHIGGEWVFVSGSCETGGTARQKCTVCKKDIAEKNVAAGAHVGLIKVSDKVTQTEHICSGIEYKCGACGESVIESKSHNYMIREEGYDPACGRAGLTASKYCAICKLEVPARAIPALEHDFEYDEDGTKYCTICGLYFVDDDTTCNHFCHNQGTIAKILTSVCTFFWKILDRFSLGGAKYQYCECGMAHYELED